MTEKFLERRTLTIEHDQKMLINWDGFVCGLALEPLPDDSDLVAEEMKFGLG